MRARSNAARVARIVIVLKPRALALLANPLLVLGSFLVGGLLVEAAVRVVDGLPLLADWLPQTVDRDVSTLAVDDIPRAPGVAREWFFKDPPPLSNRHAPPADWVKLAREMGERQEWDKPLFHQFDYFKAWNAAFVGDPCGNAVLRQAPGRLFVFDPVDGEPMPYFRFLPDATTPVGLVTNRMGWRGPPVELAKGPRTVRIAFLGGSTTVNSHYYPYSYPELVGAWLNLWAAAQGLDLRFEILNTGRETLGSVGIEAVVRTELLPFRPDLVVYYEGANQFSLRDMIEDRPGALKAARPAPPLGEVRESAFSKWLRDAANRSAVARRVQSGLGMVGNPGDGAEWSKPDYTLAWPAGLDENDPDLSRPDLPVNLSVIVADLDRILALLKRIDSELVISSFKWFVHDGLVVDPVRNQGLIGHLNVGMFPARYRDLERMVAFENRVFAKYARERGLGFIDVAGGMPERPDLYTDAVHFSYGGVRLHAWLALQALVPMIEKQVAAGAWPRSPAAPAAAPAGMFIVPRQIEVSCPDD